MSKGLDVSEEFGALAPRFLSRARSVHLPAGAVLLTHGVASSTLYVVVSGQLRATRPVDGGDLDFGTIGPGSWIGEVSYIDGGPATATVTATVPTELLALDHAGLPRLIEEDAPLASALLKRVTRDLAQRVRRTSSGVLLPTSGGGHRIAQDRPRAWWWAALAWIGLEES